MSILDRNRTPAATWTGPVEHYLDVFVNDLPMHRVVPVEIDDGGRFTMTPADLERAGLLAQKEAIGGDGRVDLSHLAGVAFLYDAPGQAIRFLASNERRSARRISARTGLDPADESDPRNEFQYGLGALFNYSLAGHTGYSHRGSRFSDPALSGHFSGRMFSPLGTVESSFTLSGGEFRRLDSNWSWSDPHRMTTLRAGDLITGGLSWTRPARLAGFQAQRNFGLRPGLITMPVPGFNGSAAVPSTVEVFLDNARRFTRDVAPGPFEVVDMPVVSGGGTARIVVRDEDGNETVTESDYFVSSRLLRQGLLDYSVEAGVPRSGYGTSIDHYGTDIFGSASMRFGVADWLTLEAHAEGGNGLFNGGAGAVAALGSLGLGSFSVAASDSRFGRGYQVNGSVEFEIGPAKIRGRTQRAFGQYADIGRVTETGMSDPTPLGGGHGSTPKSLDQLSLSMPVPFGWAGAFSLSYTQLETFGGGKSKLVGLSFGRSLLGGHFSASGYADIEKGRHAFFAGFSMPIGDSGIRAATSVRQTDRGRSAYASLSRPGDARDGDVGWRLLYEQSGDPRVAASANVRTSLADVEGTVRHGDGHTSASARISGSVVAADGSLFVSRRIDDAFAVVDAGASGVPVRYENRVEAVTGRNGKAILPDLRSWERNRIGIDTDGLPLDVVATHTKQTVIPAGGNGVVVSFARKGNSAIVVFRDAAGEFVPAGTEGRIEGSAEAFVVGFDGEAFIAGLQARNDAVLPLADGSTCRASFGFEPVPGRQAVIDDVPCGF